MIPKLFRIILGALLVTTPAAAQTAIGYAPDDARQQVLLEQRVLEAIDVDWLDSLALALAREPHVAGTPAQRRSRDLVHELTTGWGLHSETPEYVVFLPLYLATVVTALVGYRP